MIFVGIDVSKDRLDVAWQGLCRPAAGFDPTPEGIAALRGLLLRQAPMLVVDGGNRGLRTRRRRGARRRRAVGGGREPPPGA